MNSDVIAATILVTFYHNLLCVSGAYIAYKRYPLVSRIVVTFTYINYFNKVFFPNLQIGKLYTINLNKRFTKLLSGVLNCTCICHVICKGSKNGNTSGLKNGNKI